MGALITDQRFKRTNDGAVWAQTMGDFASWSDYVRAFGSLTVLARVNHCDQIPLGHVRADGPGVAFHALPGFVGGWAMLRLLPRTLAALGAGLSGVDAVVIRGPGTIGMLAWPVLLARRTPFGVEVIGDVQEVLRFGGVGGRLGPWLSWPAGRIQALIVSRARSVAYVTDTSLQRKYPSSTGREVNISDVELPPEAFAKGPRTYLPGHRARRLILVGSLAQPYKGVDMALRAIAHLGLAQQYQLTVVGDGRLRGTYEELAAQLGVAGLVTFVGALPKGVEVRNALSQADMLIMPSRTEGMPRALLEAMALGLPCVGTDVGDIADLIGRENTVPRHDHKALAALLSGLTSSRLERMSSSNFDRAREIASKDRSAARIKFLSSLRGAGMRR